MKLAPQNLQITKLRQSEIEFYFQLAYTVACEVFVGREIATSLPRTVQTQGSNKRPAKLPTMRVLKPHLDATNELSLATLPAGAQARVISVNGSGPIARRLMEMGVVPGAPVRVIKSAPLGDPIEIRVRGYHLALRRTEAETISVTTTEK